MKTMYSNSIKKYISVISIFFLYNFVLNCLRLQYRHYMHRCKAKESPPPHRSYSNDHLGTCFLLRCKNASTSCCKLALDLLGILLLCTLCSIMLWVKWCREWVKCILWGWGSGFLDKTWKWSSSGNPDPVKSEVPESSSAPVTGENCACGSTVGKPAPERPEVCAGSSDDPSRGSVCDGMPGLSDWWVPAPR